MQETQEMQVPPLGPEDTLEKEMATHSTTLIWEIPCTEEHGGLQSMGSEKSHARLNDRNATILIALSRHRFSVIWRKVCV